MERTSTSDSTVKVLKNCQCYDADKLVGELESSFICPSTLKELVC